MEAIEVMFREAVRIREEKRAEKRQKIEAQKVEILEAAKAQLLSIVTAETPDDLQVSFFMDDKFYLDETLSELEELGFESSVNFDRGTGFRFTAHLG